MRVGIVTFHCAYNFGSVLQAYALKRCIELMGHEVNVVDFRGPDFKQYKLMSLTRPKRVISNITHYQKNRRRRDSFEGFITENLSLTRRYTMRSAKRMRELSKEFDCFVCGSDQIWNLDCTHGPIAPYFLDFAGDARRVAYAPSLSHTSFEECNFGPDQQRLISRWLSRFAAISVRESSTVELFQPLVPLEIKVCLDPTLLLDADDYSAVLRPVDCSGMLFVYVLEDNPSLIEYSSRLAKKMGLAVGYVSKDDIDFGVSAHNFYGVGPGEFLGIVASSEAVITNSFHATVFSLAFGRPFQTFSTARSGARMTELLTDLGEESHLVTGDEIALPSSAPQDVLVRRLSRRRDDSLAYLSAALSE